MIAFLVCAYALSYFALFPRLTSAGATRSSPTSSPTSSPARRAEVLALVHAVLLLPFGCSLATSALVVIAAAAHVALDALEARLARRVRIRGAEPLLAGLVAHLALAILLGRSVESGAWAAWSAPAGATHAALLVAILAFNGLGAADLVGAVLAPLQGEGADAGPRGAGRRIGMLERWIVVVLVAMGEWGAVGLVLTAKSVARFKKMDDQAFAETYLVGTMTSVLIAMATGLLLRYANGS